MKGELVSQPTKMPTRKLFAVILATFIVQGVIGVLEHFFPGISSALPGQEWIELLIPLFAGYMVRERAVIPPAASGGVAALILAVFLSGSAEPAQAHEWYDANCCSGRDCAPISTDRVDVTREGYVITLKVGDHPVLKRDRVYRLPFDSRTLKESRDGNFHLCIGIRTNNLLCLYEPTGGV